MTHRQTRHTGTQPPLCREKVTSHRSVPVLRKSDSPTPKAWVAFDNTPPTPNALGKILIHHSTRARSLQY